jgi:hypothetical protein
VGHASILPRTYTEASRLDLFQDEVVGYGVRMASADADVELHVYLLFHKRGAGLPGTYTNNAIQWEKDARVARAVDGICSTA